MNFFKAFHRSVRYKVTNSDGDTIVEVLICLAIVATLLGGAFTLTRSSRLGVRNSEEHTEALKVAENQIEQIRGNVQGDELIFADTNVDFCMYNQEPHTEANVPSPPSDNPSDYDPNCRQNSSGGLATPGEEPTYLIDINDCNNNGDCGSPEPNSHLYTVTVTWDQITSGSGSVQLVYRLYDNGGAAAFVGQTCAPGQCTGHPGFLPGAKYHWARTFTNISPPWEKSLITSCTWNFDDGTTVSSPPDTLTPSQGTPSASCLPGDAIYHIFTPKNLPVPNPYVQSYCQTNTYNVTLTLTLSSGATVPYSKPVLLPKCGPGNGP